MKIILPNLPNCPNCHRSSCCLPRDTTTKIESQQLVAMEALPTPGAMGEYLATLRTKAGNKTAARVLLAYAKMHEDAILVGLIFARSMAQASSNIDSDMDEFNADIQRVMRGCP